METASASNCVPSRRRASNAKHGVPGNSELLLALQAGRNNLAARLERTQLTKNQALLRVADLGIELDDEIRPNAENLEMLHGYLHLFENLMVAGHHLVEVVRGQAKGHRVGLQAEALFHPAQRDQDQQDHQRGEN